MPTYRYKCEDCGVTELIEHPMDAEPEIQCEHPDGLVDMVKVFGFSFRPSMPEHFSHTAGKYVSNERQFSDELKRKSDDASERLGIDHDFQPVDLREKEALGVDDQGLDETRRREVASGKREVKRYL